MIAVQYPYYKLLDVIDVDETSIKCKFKTEQILEFERGHCGVSSSEMARHMAIAGSLACAKVNPIKSKHRYLAFKGTCWKVPYETPKDEINVIYANCIHFDEDYNIAIAEMMSNGFRMKVTYTIAPSMDPNLTNMDKSYHYTTIPETQVVEITSDSISARLSSCSFPGHFGDEEFYAIASVASIFNRLIGKLLNSTKDSYDTILTQVQANRLVRSSNPVIIRVTRIQEEEGPSNIIKIHAHLTEDEKKKPAIGIEYTIQLIKEVCKI